MMHQSISLTDWQKSGGAKDYNALPEAGCIALADEGVTRTACSTLHGAAFCIALADEGLAQASRTSVPFPNYCVSLADEGVTQASRSYGSFRGGWCVSLADERMM